MKEENGRSQKKRLMLTTVFFLFNYVYAQSQPIDWAGPFFGMQVNFNSFSEEWTSDEDFDGIQFSDTGNNTGIGLVVGYNTVKNNVLFGLEGNISTGSANAVLSVDGRADYLNRGQITHMGHAYPRIGYIFNEKVLIFISAGLAMASVDHQTEYLNNGDNTFSQIACGFSKGIGLEYALNQNFRIKAHFSKDVFSNTGFADSENSDSFFPKPELSIVQIGINYAF